ncbi:MAG TPA: glycosyltransferase family 2 protein [Candidatus Paceibacterota bacterium]
MQTLVVTCSVIIPVYNSEKYLEMTIKSVIVQTYADIEIVIIDDCSTDSSYDVIKKWGAADSRIRILRNEKKLGVAETRNKGIETALGEYIALLDSDDIWLPEKLEKQISFMEEKCCSLSYCSYDLINSTDNIFGEPFLVPKMANLSALLKNNFLSCSTIIVRREFFLNHLFSSEYYHEDYVVWLSMLKECKIVYGINEVLAKYRVMKGTRSANKIKSAKERWKIYRDLLKMNVFVSIYFFAFYVYKSLKKYKKIN